MKTLGDLLKWASYWAALLCCVSACSGGNVEVEWPSGQFLDLGTQPPNTEHLVRFQFVSRASVPIRVVGVKASCGCTKPQFSPEWVSTGDSGWIEASVEVGQVGLKEAELLVSFEGGSPSQALLKLRFNPDMAIRIEPRMISLSGVQSGREVPQAFKVIANGDKRALLDAVATMQIRLDECIVQARPGDVREAPGPLGLISTVDIGVTFSGFDEHALASKGSVSIARPDGGVVTAVLLVSMGNGGRSGK